MAINIDDLGPDKKPGQTINPEMSLIPTTPQAKVPESRKLTDIYDEHQKLCYLFDRSGSMGQKVAGVEDLEIYEWNERDMDEINNKIDDAVLAIESDPDKYAEASIAVLSASDPWTASAYAALTKWASLKSLKGDDLKRAVMQGNLDVEVYLTRNSAKYDARATKMGLVNKMARKQIEDRFEKFPQADVECFVFNHQIERVEHTGNENLIDKVSKLTHFGGTRIYDAVEEVVNFCKKNRSKVGLHHIVLVTDGEDSSATRFPELIERMRDLGVTLDFIFIGAAGKLVNRAVDTVQAIRRVCDATGGTYTEVFNAHDFELKFIEASTRLLLPAPAETN